MRARTAVAAVAALVVAGCSGPGSDATFDEDAPGADAAPVEAGDTDGDAENRPVVQGREDPSETQEADLGEYTERACGRAVTPSGRYSQSGYDRGVREGVEAGLDEDELVAAIDEACGDEIEEARGE